MKGLLEVRHIKVTNVVLCGFLLVRRSCFSPLGFFSSAVLSYFPTIMPFLMPCQSSLPGINPIKTFLSKFNDSYLKATPFLEQRKNIYSYKMVWFTKKE